MPAVKLAVVADIHHGRDTLTKSGGAALPLLQRFVDSAAHAGADAIIDLGDRISDVDRTSDIELARAVGDAFRRTNRPRYHVNGNHDRQFMTAADNEMALAASTGTRVAEAGGVRLVFWQPDVTLSEERPLRLEPGDLDALRDTLHASPQRTLLFSHVPLSGHAMTGNFWFEANPEYASYAETPDIRAVLAQAPCPIVAFAGHVHWNTLTTVDGTPHITCQSLTERATTGGAPAGAMGLVEIEGESLKWKVAGNDPIELVLRFPHEKPRWVRPLPAFREVTRATVARVAAELSGDSKG
jgi:predicted phosphodiesterase